MTAINPIQARVFSKLGQSGSIFGMALVELAKDIPELVVLTADTAASAGLDRFITAYPDRFYNIGIAEQNMTGIASGLAHEGYKPIITTFATFLPLRSGEQMRQYLGYMQSKVIVIGLCAGFTLTILGNSHYAIEDMAIMRSIPNMTVLSPSDAGQAAKLFEAAVALNGPVYIRLVGRQNCPIIYKEDYTLEIGKNIVVKEGNDVTIFATGIMVSNSLKAADLLQEKKISAKVVDVHTIKPLDIQSIKDSLGSKLFASVEEHTIIGGLGGAISEILAEQGVPIPLLRLGIKDTFCKVGDYNYLLEQNRLLPEQIAADIISRYESIK
jgi:transketolase